MQNKLAALVIITLLPFFGVNAEAQERRGIPPYRELNIEPESDTQRELHAFIEEYRTAWSEENTEGFIALHTADTEWINAYARMFIDSEALGIFLETRLFPNFGPGVSRQEAQNMQLISMRSLSDDAAVLHLYTDGSRGPSAIEGRALRRTHFHLVLTRHEGEWKIAHTAIMDARD